ADRQIRIASSFVQHEEQTSFRRGLIGVVGVSPNPGYAAAASTTGTETKERFRESNRPIVIVCCRLGYRSVRRVQQRPATGSATSGLQRQISVSAPRSAWPGGGTSNPRPAVAINSRPQGSLDRSQAHNPVSSPEVSRLRAGAEDFPLFLVYPVHSRAAVVEPR